MSQQDDLRSITTFLKDQRAAANDKSPLPFPAILADETANPEKKALAEEAYTSALLSRRSLTEAESKWLLSGIRKHLGGE
jgi:hypothetical protein